MIYQWIIYIKKNSRILSKILKFWKQDSKKKIFVMISITWMSEQDHEILLTKQSQASFKFQISSMKISLEIFSFIYKIILYFILLLIKQHELMIFKSELNVIHKIDDDYTSIKHHLSMLSSKRMRKLEFKADELYITAQSVRQISWHDRSVNEAVWV